eukprot:TRINITY_DN1649_c0_g1_i2.p1 TRINITY_DN1649_c0_g1~~TRINITY_DN1649_c0_g1_i2.p1  ORF type:complete len:344 (-),score=60.16 TRINITY_DN1649_c0_g1_i2:126-1157(-)
MEYKKVLFDHQTSKVLVAADGKGSGYWVGACSVALVDGNAYVYYRRRGPRPDRGNRCYIIKSDGLHNLENQDSWKRIWEGRKEDLVTVEGQGEGSPSFEKSALVFFPQQSIWRLYISYVDPVDQRWRIDAIEAQNPSEFSFKPSHRREVLTAASTDTEGVKDPEVVQLSPNHYRMYFTYVPKPPSQLSNEQMHGTADILNTGASKAYTGYADSIDGGKTFVWNKASPQIALAPPSNPDAWDCYCARLTTVFNGANENEKIGLYDGTQSVEGNYEEKTGLSVSTDGGVTFERKTIDGPILTSNCTSALRYIQHLDFEGKRHWIYEAANDNGSHDIWINVTPLAS